MKRSLIALSAIAALGLLATSASAHGTVTVLIRHQLHGCHAWSVNGNAYKPSQTVKVDAGTTIVFTNNDVMAHKLVQTSGPRVTIKKVASTMMDMSHEFKGSGVMAHSGASVRVMFFKPGVYRFTTKAGEDYMKMPATIGEDNVLKLKVVVS
jgi:plastocyanin